MKIFFISLALSFLNLCIAYAQDYSEQKEITNKVIQYFEGNQSEDIYNLFDDTMKSAITVEKLSEIWMSLPLQCGYWNLKLLILIYAWPSMLIKK